MRDLIAAQPEPHPGPHHPRSCQPPRAWCVPPAGLEDLIGTRWAATTSVPNRNPPGSGYPRSLRSGRTGLEPGLLRLRSRGRSHRRASARFAIDGQRSGLRRAISLRIRSVSSAGSRGLATAGSSGSELIRCSSMAIELLADPAPRRGSRSVSNSKANGPERERCQGARRSPHGGSARGPCTAACRSGCPDG